MIALVGPAYILFLLCCIQCHEVKHMRDIPPIVSEEQLGHLYIHYTAMATTVPNIYRRRLFAMDVPRLQKESGQIAHTSPSAPSHSAWSSAPWGFLRCPREPSNLLPLMGSEPALPDRLRQNNNNNNNCSHCLIQFEQRNVIDI